MKKDEVDSNWSQNEIFSGEKEEESVTPTYHKDIMSEFRVDKKRLQLVE